MVTTASKMQKLYKRTVLFAVQLDNTTVLLFGISQLYFMYFNCSSLSELVNGVIPFNQLGHVKANFTSFYHHVCFCVHLHSILAYWFNVVFLNTNLCLKQIFPLLSIQLICFLATLGLNY